MGEDDETTRGLLGWIEFFWGYFFGNMDDKWMSLVRKQTFFGDER
jgi:hypothetical protein